MQGIELGLKAMAAAGAHTVATLQQSPSALYADRPRDASGKFTDTEKFQRFLRTVRDVGERTAPFACSPLCVWGCTCLHLSRKHSRRH